MLLINFNSLEFVRGLNSSPNVPTRYFWTQKYQTNVTVGNSFGLEVHLEYLDVRTSNLDFRVNHCALLELSQILQPPTWVDRNFNDLAEAVADAGSERPEAIYLHQRLNFTLNRIRVPRSPSPQSLPLDDTALIANSGLQQSIKYRFCLTNSTISSI